MLRGFEEWKEDMIAEASGADWGMGVTMTHFCFLLFCFLKIGSPIAPAEAVSGKVTGTRKL